MTVDILELTTTTETEEQAQELARQLVRARLAACVQVVGPIHSVYRWQGEICESAEFRLTAKSIPQRQASLLDFVKSVHPYQTPEILVHVVQVSEEYGRWLTEQVSA